MLELRAAAESRTGRRQRNEDSYHLDADLGLFVVADGMGGYEAGDVASQTAVDAIHEFVEESRGASVQSWPHEIEAGSSLGENIVKRAVQSADRAVSTRSEEDATRMGTTVVVVAQRGDDAVIGHVGDSRVYRLRGGSLEQMTTDHSFAREVEGSTLGAQLGSVLQTYQNFITRALGAFNQGDAVPDVRRIEIEEGDRFLLSSDGIHDTLSHDTLERIIGERDRARVPERLVDAAFEYGSTDNLTAAVVEAVSAEEEPGE